MKRRRSNEGAPANRHPPRGSSARPDCLFIGLARHAQVRVPVAELGRSLRQARVERGQRFFFDHGWTQMHTDRDLSVFIRVHLWLYF